MAVEYLTVDLDGTDADIKLSDPYKIPLENQTADIVLCGQMFEHCEFFWLTFTEMIRLLKPNGYLFLIAPSSGPIHQYPVDCYRFYPDAFRALAKYGKCNLIEMWLDLRGPWRDLVGIFRQADAPLPIRPIQATAASAVVAVDHFGAPPEAEILRGGLPYLEVLNSIHRTLEPLNYLEIGVRHGRSLRLASCRALGVDPYPEIEGELAPNVSLVRATSDDFFSAPEARAMPRPDFAFIDGMHHFEYALRDFINIEQRAHHASVLVFDDVFPNHRMQAERNRRTRAWAGDVWKIVECLRTYREDLILLPLDAHPAGLLVVAGLSPGNRVLEDNYNPIVRHYQQQKEPSAAILNCEGALPCSDPRLIDLLQLLQQNRLAGTDAKLLGLHLAAWRLQNGLG